MEFISAEEFQKQPVEIQAVFSEWWIPKIGDLFFTNEYGMELFLGESEEGILGSKEFYTSEKTIPLLTEGQLRQFIEDKTNSKADIIHSKIDGYGIELYEIESYGYFIDGFTDLGENLLQAYWKVALEIAKEKVKA